MFESKLFVSYLWIFLFVLILVFIFISLIYAIRTPLRKWLWIIFILFGFVSFSLNWTTGEFGLINFLLFGAGIVKSGIIAPWIVSFSIPVGTLVFLFKRNKILNEMEDEDINTATNKLETWSILLIIKIIFVGRI